VHWHANYAFHSIQHSETFYVLLAFLALVVAKLSALKYSPVFGRNSSLCYINACCVRLGILSHKTPSSEHRGWSAITPKANTTWLRAPAWKSICRDISAVNVPILTKFGNRMQNNTPITSKWWRSKPEVEFQYSGRLFFKTGSSYISATNWDMLTKLGLLIDFVLLKTETSTNTKSEVVLSGRGRHLEKWIWRHISAAGAPI